MAQQDVVIITGSSGFIGAALINRLAGRYALAGFDRIASRTPPPAAECIRIDLISEEAVKKAFEQMVTISIIAMAEVARPLRFLNTLCGLWLIAAPWLLEGASPLAASLGTAAGLGLVILSLPRGTLSAHHYGTWDRLIV